MRASLLLLCLLPLSINCFTFQTVFEFAKGMFLGSKLESLTPTDEACVTYTVELVEAMKAFVKNTHTVETTFEMLNELTSAFIYIPKAARSCVQVPMATWAALQKYFKTFGYSWASYFEAVALGCGYNADELALNYFNFTGCMAKGDILTAGYVIGDTLNLILNVTSKEPVPLTDDDVDVVDPVPTPSPAELIPYREFHEEFEKWVKYVCTTMLWTRLTNETTIVALNSSVYMIEYSVYHIIVNVKTGHIEEAILDAIDILGDLNNLLDGVVYLIEELPYNLIYDNIFDHISYAWENFAEHAGYYVFDALKIYWGVKDGDLLDVCRRIGDLVNKILLFDVDVMDDIKDPFKDPLA